MPAEHSDRGLHWLLEVTGDGWSAAWWSDRPVTGPVELRGRFFVDHGSGASDDPAPARGRVRRVRLVEQQRVRTATGEHLVEGSERLTDIEATPHRFWSNWDDRTEGEDFVRTGVLIDLDLDDVPAPRSGFVAGAVSVHGADVWVIDRSNPVLLHLDTESNPHRVVEYLLPLTIEPPTGEWTRAVHADGGGCWITSRHDVFRCDRSGSGTLTVQRMCTDGGRGVVAEGRLYLLGSTRPMLCTDRRHGMVRVDPDPHPVRMLEHDGRLTPVKDRLTLARVTAWACLADRARGGDGTEWAAAGSLAAQSPDGTVRSIDLDTRTRGDVYWVHSDPLADPANAGLVPVLSLPTAPVETACCPTRPLGRIACLRPVPSSE
ncbi:hypothetical protein ERC79_01585 [Rhodococcus sp. ABRD24]|uniref:hypothetical protein n=1 Tax=Rhodococcus sp. ABRD24 TaxID=2507582 RepID=UPI00103C9C8C|nr:hypothetical protein [Rhodococcus sp. ABRD24]QBJ94801.1 hypothetical protein ERC79_01585 [Rhodococcus sp. ABRD24]